MSNYTSRQIEVIDRLTNLDHRIKFNDYIFNNVCVECTCCGATIIMDIDGKIMWNDLYTIDGELMSTEAKFLSCKEYQIKDLIT